MRPWSMRTASSPAGSLTTERDGGRRVQGRRHSEGVLVSWVAVSLPTEGGRLAPGGGQAMPLSCPRHLVRQKQAGVFDPELGLPFPTAGFIAEPAPGRSRPGWDSSGMEQPS
jgi:hypothetical protein